MRKFLLSLGLLLLGIVTVHGQQKIYIHLGDGTVLSHNVADVDSITFGEETTVPPAISGFTLSSLGSTNATFHIALTGTRSLLTSVGVQYSSNAMSISSGTRTNAASIPSEADATVALTGLSASTTYYALPYIVVDGQYTYGPDTLTFTTDSLSRFPMPAAVDLGLSVKWASWNVGAQTAYDYGLYIGWGDSTGVRQATDASVYPSISNISGTAYDVAHAKWGDGWQMPSVDQFQELRENCSWTAQTVNGVSGWLVTSKVNGNSIFLPRGGFYSPTDKKYEYVGNDTRYWTGQHGSTQNTAVSVYIFPADSEISTNTEKIVCLPIRAIYTGSSTPDPTPTPQPTDTIPGAQVPLSANAGQAVDLGLSVKWASFNLGASSSTEAGNYYAWGETTTKDSYSLSTYQYYVTSSTDSIYTPENLKQISATKYDAARMNWGGAWRLPTLDEMQELISYCTWTWDSSRHGYTVTGTNGNSIFLPASGYKVGSDVVLSGAYGNYWTGTNYDREPMFKDKHAYYLMFGETYTPQYPTDMNKEMGYNIRPVQDN